MHGLEEEKKKKNRGEYLDWPVFFFFCCEREGEGLPLLSLLDGVCE